MTSNIYLGDKLGYKKMEDWYSISVKDVGANHGWAFLNSYSDLRQAVMDTFPEHTWEPWKFRHVKNYWTVQSNRALFFEYLLLSRIEKLKIKL